MQNRARYLTANQFQETKKEQKRDRNEIEQKKKQSQTNRTFQNKNHGKKLNANENTTSGQYDVSTVKNSSNSKLTIIENEVNCENVYHWGASREIMEIIRRRNKSPETIRLLEIKETLAWPVTMGRRYDPQSQSQCKIRETGKRLLISMRK